MVVDLVDARHDETHCDQEADSWTEIHEAYLKRVEAVAFTINGLKLRKQAVSY